VPQTPSDQFVLRAGEASSAFPPTRAPISISWANGRHGRPGHAVPSLDQALLKAWGLAFPTRESRAFDKCLVPSLVSGAATCPTLAFALRPLQRTNGLSLRTTSTRPSAQGRSADAFLAGAFTTKRGNPPKD